MLSLYFLTVKEARNIDLENIITPVNASKLQDLLTISGYPPLKTKFIVDGFKSGFSLKYQGNLEGQHRTAPNLKLRIGNKTELWNKVMNEVELGRFARLFEFPPFKHFVQSPIGLVPKDKGLKTRLIFHLSYPRDRDSVNSGIPYSECTVKYPDFDEAVKLCLQEGVGCSIGKSDMSSAFRHIPMARDQWWLLVMKAEHPSTGKSMYFIDKCLPFGSSINCAIFQAVSDAITWIVKFKTKKENVNYLDDYLFAAALKAFCDQQMKIFLEVCQEIQFPVVLEKTFWGTPRVTFLGMLLDTIRQVICIPMDKLIKASNWVDYFLNKKNKKVTVLEFQKLCGILNFLCKCLVPGRAFVRILYVDTTRNGKVLKPHHHIKITEENKLDLLVWKQFLLHPDSHIYRPFMESVSMNATQIDMFSDTSGNFKLGFGAFCGTEWTFGQQDSAFCSKYEPSIEYLELFGVLVGILNWIKLFRNRRIILFCDNQAVVNMINNSALCCKNCMVLIRLLTTESILQNVRVFAKYVPTGDNGKADALSRLDLDRFWRLSCDDNMNPCPSAVPEAVWPVSKIWMH